MRELYITLACSAFQTGAGEGGSERQEREGLVVQMGGGTVLMGAESAQSAYGLAQAPSI